MSDTTEQSPEQLEIAFISSVDAKAKEFSAQLRDELEKMSYINLAYRRGSAGNLYGQRPWHRVIKHYQDGFGFLEAATTD